MKSLHWTLLASPPPFIASFSSVGYLFPPKRAILSVSNYTSLPLRYCLPSAWKKAIDFHYTRTPHSFSFFLSFISLHFYLLVPSSFFDSFYLFFPFTLLSLSKEGGGGGSVFLFMMKLWFWLVRRIRYLNKNKTAALRSCFYSNNTYDSSVVLITFFWKDFPVSALLLLCSSSPVLYFAEHVFL